MSILEKMLEMTEDAGATGTPDPDALLAKAKQPASVLAVDVGIKTHAEHCQAKKSMRKLVVIGAFALGIFSVVQIWAAAHIHSAVAELREKAKSTHASGGIISSAVAAEQSPAQVQGK